MLPLWAVSRALSKVAITYIYTFCLHICFRNTWPDLSYTGKTPYYKCLIFIDLCIFKWARAQKKKPMEYCAKREDRLCIHTVWSGVSCTMRALQSTFWQNTVQWCVRKDIDCKQNIDGHLTIPSLILSISMHRHYLVKVHSFSLKILSGNEILMLFKVHISKMNTWH